MKHTLALAGFCTFLFACQAAHSTNPSHSIPPDGSPVSTAIDSAGFDDGGSALTPISAHFTPDGPNGPVPYTCVQEPAKVHNPGDGCCG